MSSAREAQHIAQAVSELVALKGFARLQGDAQLGAVWEEVAGPIIAAGTKVLGIKRGVLHVAVANSALLSELALFRKPSLLDALTEEYSDLKVRDVRFRLNGDAAGT